METVHSVVKRKSGSYARSRIPGQLEKEIALKIIAYNIRKIITVNGSKIIFIIEVPMKKVLCQIMYPGFP